MTKHQKRIWNIVAPKPVGSKIASLQLHQGPGKLLKIRQDLLDGALFQLEPMELLKIVEKAIFAHELAKDILP